MRSGSPPAARPAPTRARSPANRGGARDHRAPQGAAPGAKREFPIADAIGFDDALDIAAEKSSRLIALRDTLPDLAELNVDDDAEKLLRNGDPRALEGRVPAGTEMFKVIHKATHRGGEGDLARDGDHRARLIPAHESSDSNSSLHCE